MTASSIRTPFAVSFVLVLALLSAFPLPTKAVVMGIAAGDLVKLEGSTAVYYLDRDWRRHPFPNVDVYKSWYNDYSGIKTLSPADMAELRLGTPIVYRPGSRLVKIVSDPKVYTVEPGGTLRAIASESVAKALYGNAWNKRVVDVPDSLFFGYVIGMPLALPAHTTGSVLRRASDAAVFVIDGARKRHVAPTVAQALAYRDPYVIDVAASLDEYEDGPRLEDAADRKYRDAAQDSRVETPSSPQIEFPAPAAQVDAPSDAAIASVKVTSAMPVIVRRVTVTIKTTLHDKGVAMLENVRLVDESGAELFGVQQVSADAGAEQRFVFSGAYTMPGNASKTMTLKANVHPLMPDGTVITAAFERDGFSLADGGSGNVIDGYFPRTAFPAVSTTARIKK